MTLSAVRYFFSKLWFRVLVGLALGIAFGFYVGPMTADQLTVSGWTPGDGKVLLTEYIKPVGTVFINLIKMVVVPLIFFSLIYGITNMTDQSAFKRVGLKSVGAYLMTGAFAVMIGLAFAHVLQPGLGLSVSDLEKHSAKPAVEKVETMQCKPHTPPDEGKPAGSFMVECKKVQTEAKASEKESAGLIAMLVNIIPPNIFTAMASDNILQVVVFAIFVAVTLNRTRDKTRPVIEFCHAAAHAMFKLIEMIVQFSPYGVFALIAWVVGTQGLGILWLLLKLVMVVFGALFTQYLLFGVMIVIFCRMSPLPFYKKMLEAQALAFSTSSSKATLSTAMRIVNERIGVSKNNTSFVLPLGASINMDGTAIYLGICALFFSQLYNVPIDTHHYFILILTATLGSIGAAGIPGGSLIMMGMVLTSVGLPLDGIALIAGVDRILDMLRTTVNITGESVITVIVDKSEGTFDKRTYDDPQAGLE